MRDRIAIYICPEPKCAVTGKKDQECHQHHKPLVRIIYRRETKAEELKATADKLRETGDKIRGRPRTPFDSVMDDLFGSSNPADKR